MTASNGPKASLFRTAKQIMDEENQAPHSVAASSGPTDALGDDDQLSVKKVIIDLTRSDGLDSGDTDDFEVTSAIIRSSSRSPLAVLSGRNTLPGGPRHTPNAEMAGPLTISLANAEPGPPLSPQQAEILARVMRGDNIFFTGPAGTGKSVLLRAIIKAFKEKEEAHAAGGGSSRAESGLAATASTGIAAMNIGGTTLHSWAGIGIALEPAVELAAIVMRYEGTRVRWETSRALLVDEISMIDGKLFDKLDFVGRTVRKTDKPFGGLQLILCGDFHQLPPVAKRGDPPAVYAFDSTAWRKMFSKSNMVCLRHVFRQKDATFSQILNEMRKGRLSGTDEARIKRLARDVAYPERVYAVELFPTKVEAERLNASRLGNLPSSVHQFESVDRPGISPGGTMISPDQARKILDDQTNFVPYLELKVGAFVMLVQNYNHSGLCNGSTGTITAFMTEEEASAQGIRRLGWAPSPYTVFPVVEFIPSRYVTEPTPKRVLVPTNDITVKNPGGSIKATRVQVPLILAWAVTVHKSQGLSLDRVKVDLQRTFADGQAYVALSRATSMEGLQVTNFSRDKLKVSYRVLEWSAQVEGDM